MSDPKQDNISPAGPVPSPGTGDTGSSSAQPAPGQLSKEEQWALFEKELKESDWGHQPC